MTTIQELEIQVAIVQAIGKSINNTDYGQIALEATEQIKKILETK